ncbi:hypothetical protein [Mycobacterium sp. SM1]|nr:hypothetical protein [Mycobacterium sp. SM1]
MLTGAPQMVPTVVGALTGAGSGAEPAGDYPDEDGYGDDGTRGVK